MSLFFVKLYSKFLGIHEICGYLNSQFSKEQQRVQLHTNTRSTMKLFRLHTIFHEYIDNMNSDHG